MNNPGDPFAPLTEAERANALAQAEEAQETPAAKLICPPAGAEAGESAATRLFGRKPDGFWTYRTADGAIAFHVGRWNEADGAKTFRPVSWHVSEGWKFAAWPAHRPLYNLPPIVNQPGLTIVVFEGEKAADAAARIFPNTVVTASSGGAGAAAKTDWTPLAGRRVTVWPDNDEPGSRYAGDVGEILRRLNCDVSKIDAAELAVTDPGGRGPDWRPDGWDAADGVKEWPDVEMLRKAALALAKPFTIIAAVPRQEKHSADEEVIGRRIVELAKLGEIMYEIARASSAKELGLQVRSLDKLVKAQRTTADVVQGRAITFPVIEPWPAPTDGTAILDEFLGALQRYVVLSPAQAVAIGLWTFFTHVHDAFDISPRLLVKSPQKRSGKTKLFTVLARLVAKPRSASGITSSALLRLIELHAPTMLIDEMDALMGADREMAQALRGMMNSGFNRAFATFTMNAPTREGGYEPREFSTWCAMALAGIGNVPETVRDRSVEIEMKRKLPGETVRKLRRRDGADLDQLARKIKRWSSDNFRALQGIEPRMPEGMNDRASDAWEPLVAIAELAGGDWPARARAAALALSGDGVAGAKDEDVDTLLFADIHAAFASKGVNKISSESLTAYLTSLEGRPWAEWKHGKPLTKHQLARRLRTYHVASGAVDLGGDEGRLKGYRREDFEDAFARYLPPDPNSTRELVIGLEKSEENEAFQLVTEKSDHELENGKNRRAVNGLHEITSSSQPRAGANALHSEIVPVEGRDGAEPLPSDSDVDVVWPGRIVV